MDLSNEIRVCPRCEGKGEYEDYFSKGCMRKCHNCDGTKTFSGFDPAAIVAAIMATKGKNKGKIRASMTSPFGEGATQDQKRAYYCWRLARFHGGRDLTQPVMADLCLRSDPFRPELDALANVVAKHQFGTDMAAALAWGRALGHIS